jgi:hypothetical protein
MACSISLAAVYCEGRCSACSSPGQFGDIHTQDLSEGRQDAMAVYLAQTALDLGQPAFRPTN